MVNFIAVQTTRFGIGQRQFLHGTRQANVGQTTFFFQPPAFIQRHLAREHPLFHPDDKHLRELQPLGRVQGHQLHRVLIGIGLPLARFQRSM
ncbi:hypothetical protein D3C72_1526060 [compost metagenome]